MKLKPFHIVILMLSSCAHSEQAVVSEKEIAPAQITYPEELVSWVEDSENGLLKNKQIGDIIYTVLYKPAQYEQVLMGERENPIAADTSKMGTGDEEEVQFFSLAITTEENKQELLRHNIESEEEYMERVNYCISEMQQDITLIDGKDTLPCVLFHFERTYNQSPGATFTLAFPYSDEAKRQRKNGDNKTKSDKIISIYDRMFNNGRVNIVFNKESFNQIPVLIKK